MIRALAIVTLAACGGSKAASPVMSNRASESTTDAEMAPEEIEGKPGDDHTFGRRQAVEQARAAGILGPRTEATATEPTLDKTAIRTVVRSRLVSVQICYEQQLLEKPTLAGTTLVDFTIGGDGTVAAASAAGFDPEVDGCVAGVIKALTFPKPAAGKMTVKYPFTFKPAS